MPALTPRAFALLALGTLAGCAADPAAPAAATGSSAATLRLATGAITPRTAEPTSEPVPQRTPTAEPAPTDDGGNTRESTPIIALAPTAGRTPVVALPVDPAVHRYPWGPLFDSAEAAADCAVDGAPRWWCGGRERPGAVDPEACPDDTWLGFRLDDAPCPAADGFVVQQPYAEAGHPDLARVCRYVWTSPDLPPAVDRLPDDRSIRLERDCQVVGGHAVPEPVWRGLEASWFTQLSLPDYGQMPDPAVPRARVAVLDSSPGGGVVGGPSPGQTSTHGLSIGNAIRAVACPAARGLAGPCAAGLSHHIALPRAYGEQRPPRGGAFGTQGEFAAAVVEALSAWKAAGGQDRLILNMSIGWTPMHGGDLDDPSRFVPMTGLWAVDLAACQGALAIAASGNRNSVDGDGATYPAAWTAEPALCDGSRPAIYAVGGVDGADAPLAIGRPGSLPRLVAPASQVIVADERFAVPADVMPLSGTSLAAAAASGAAALVWAWRPDYDAADVMDALYSAAAPLDAFAEVDLQGGVERRRLDVCAALLRACAGGACAVPPPACPGRPVDARPDHATLLDLMHDGAAELDGDPVPPSDPVDVADAPYSLPQPGITQCPYCGLAQGTLYGTLVSSPGAILLGTVLQIDDGISGVAIPLPNLPEGTPFKLPTGYHGEVKGAWLEGQVWLDGKIIGTASDIVVVP